MHEHTVTAEASPALIENYPELFPDNFMDTIVIPGLTHPPELFPGMKIIDSAIQEGITTYAISFLEILQALGVFGIIGFLFGLGLKIFKLLPTEARILKHPISA